MRVEEKHSLNYICVTCFHTVLICFIGHVIVSEPITIELYLVNPLKVALTLTDVMLLWSFLPNICSHEKPQLITNEHMVTAKVSI